MLLDAVSESPPLAVKSLAGRFGVEDVLTAHKDTVFQASLLYYFGVLSFGDLDHVRPVTSEREAKSP